MRNTRFTLIELLVVVAIISLLLTLLMPSLSQAREKAKEAVCLSNERQTGLGLLNYTMDSSGFLPPAYDFSTRYSWDDNISVYLDLKWPESEKSKNGSENLDNWEIFKCPSNTVTLDDPRKSYAVNAYDPDSFRHKPGLMGDDVSVMMARISQPAMTLMLGEQWRIWNKLGSESAQNSGYGYAKLKYEVGCGWWENLKCHGNGRANLLMSDGSAQMMNGKTLLKGSLDETSNRYQGSWLDHTK